MLGSTTLGSPPSFCDSVPIYSLLTLKVRRKILGPTSRNMAKIEVIPSTPAAPSPRPRNFASKVRVNPCLGDFARSHSVNWCPPARIVPENEALASLKAAWKKNPGPVPQYNGYTPGKPLLCVDLFDFEIYRSPIVGHSARKSELISLHLLQVPSAKKLCFDGFLRVGGITHYVQGIEIEDCSIEGYGEDRHPDIVAYIQSEFASKNARYDVWYRLRQPSAVYKRFHEPFLWIAQLGKHVIDYMETQPIGSVTLGNFRKDFLRWLLRRFVRSKSFKAWHIESKERTDFRVAVHAYIDFIYHQAFNLSNLDLLTHPLWGECMVKGMAIVKPQPQIEQHTIATPVVYEAFKHMYFGNYIRALKASQKVEHEQEHRKRQLGFITASKNVPLATSTRVLQLYRGALVSIGDVVALRSNEVDRKVWRSSGDEWLAYVYDVKMRKDNIQELAVLWLYQSWDTSISKAKYAFKNELFFSDNCNCNEDKLLSTDVVGRYNVRWLPNAIPSSQFFVRQTYVTGESAFKTFKEEHKRTCMCKIKKTAPSQKFRRGDTVYITTTLKGEKILEPAIVWEMHDVGSRVTVRNFLRLGRDCASLAMDAGRTDIASNELVLTDEYSTIAISRLQRECFVRYLTKEQLHSIPSPYDRGGAGDRWFVSMSIALPDAQLRFLVQSPKCFREAPVTKCRKLKGLSIFSGGGSLDRGIEEGGGVEFHTAVDFSPHAIHTQRANARNPKICLYCGSVDDYLKAALKGTNRDLIAGIGKVEFLCAGSPCPGFSTLQQNFRSKASLRNASHISTFLSFVDLFRPLYGVLENVVSMASTRTGFEDENVLSSVIACLVSMGYQVNQYIMDGWNYGSAQRRSRILITIAAPGLTPVDQPWHTHSASYEVTKSKSLGNLPNGQRLGERESYPTPFPVPSAGQVAADLPDIGNGNAQTCVSFPDHRVFPLPTIMERSLLKHIPKSPPGCGYAEAMKLGLIPKMLQRNKTETGRSYTRIKQDGLIPCITTRLRIADSRNGATIHWAQDRPITILEARRAQNYPDDEPIIGTLAQQFEIVGNGVDRMVSLAFGLSLRQALEVTSLASNPLMTRNFIQDAEREIIVVDDSYDDDGYLTDATQSNMDLSSAQDASFRSKKTMAHAAIIPANSKANKNNKVKSFVTTYERSHPKKQSKSHKTAQTMTRNTVQDREREIIVIDDSNDDGYLTDATQSSRELSSAQDLVRSKKTITHTVIIPAKAGKNKAKSSERPHPKLQSESKKTEKRMAHTVTSKVNELSMSTTKSFFKSAKTSLPRKRARRDEIEYDGKGTTSVEAPRVGPRKRTRTFIISRSSSVLTDKSTDFQSQRDLRATSISSTKSRHTRPPGFGVDFAPVIWNKRPELSRFQYHI